MEEVEIVVRKLKAGKAAEIDGVRPELIKRRGPSKHSVI